MSGQELFKTIAVYVGTVAVIALFLLFKDIWDHGLGNVNLLIPGLVVAFGLTPALFTGRFMGLASPNIVSIPGYIVRSLIMGALSTVFWAFALLFSVYVVMSWGGAEGLTLPFRWGDLWSVYVFALPGGLMGFAAALLSFKDRPRAAENGPWSRSGDLEDLRRRSRRLVIITAAIVFLPSAFVAASITDIVPPESISSYGVPTGGF